LKITKKDIIIDWSLWDILDKPYKILTPKDMHELYKDENY